MRCTALALLGLAISACDSSGTLAALPDASADATAVEAAPPDPCADAGVPPSTLDCTGLYADFASKVVSPDAVAYTPAIPLWSDGASKQRWIELPPNTQIDDSNPDEWTFPVGTKLFKEFRVGGKRVETRLFVKSTSNFWNRGTYLWNADDSEAVLSDGTRQPVALADGGTWEAPSDDDCDQCHRGRVDRILGFEQVGLGLPTAQGLTLGVLAAEGLLTQPPKSVSLTIGDDGTGLDSIALGWIHVNCGVTCHNANASAAGSGAGMILRLDPTQLDGSPPNAATWNVLETTLNVPCVSGSVSGQPRIVPGDAADSVLYQLMTERGTLQMPPIATTLVDAPDVAVVRAWIQAMGQAEAGAPEAGSLPEAGLEAGTDAAADGSSAGEGGDDAGTDGD